MIKRLLTIAKAATLVGALAKYQNSALERIISHGKGRELLQKRENLNLKENSRRVNHVDLSGNFSLDVDLALKYGYESPTAFNRAFQNIHGVTPKMARKQGVSLKAYPRIVFQIAIKGDVEMNYRIEKLESFKVIGVKKRFLMSMEDAFIQVPQFWQETVQSGVVPDILALLEDPSNGLLGVSTCMNGEDFYYYIAVRSTKDTPANMEEYIVPKGTWAIFECVGAMPKAIQDLQKRIVTEWLPTSGYEYADAPDIEVYFAGD